MCARPILNSCSTSYIGIEALSDGRLRIGKSFTSICRFSCTLGWPGRGTHTGQWQEGTRASGRNPTAMPATALHPTHAHVEQERTRGNAAHFEQELLDEHEADDAVSVTGDMHTGQWQERTPTLSRSSLTSTRPTMLFLSLATCTQGSGRNARPL